MVLGFGLLAVSAVMLIAGAELFTENAAAAARGLGITVFGAAFLLAGAEPEEMITAVVASGRHRPGLAAGDAIGASLTMLTLVLGVAALARPLPFGGRVRGYALWSAAAGGLAARGSDHDDGRQFSVAVDRPGWHRRPNRRQAWRRAPGAGRRDHRQRAGHYAPTKPSARLLGYRPPR